MVIGTYILIITINVNGLNAPTLKGHRITREENKRGKGKKDLEKQIQNNSQKWR